MGFTLLEVLLSVTILSIVLITFFGFFSQGALFNKKTDDKMTGVYFANEQMITLQDELGEILLDKILLNDPSTLLPSTYNFDVDGNDLYPNFNITEIQVIEDVDTSTTIYRLRTDSVANGLSSIINIEFYEEGYTIQTADPVKKLSDLYFTHIEVLDTNGKKLHDLIGTISY